jgi:hypothetical protein
MEMSRAAVHAVAQRRSGPPPEWAILQRQLFDDLDHAWRKFSERCTEPDGRLRVDAAIGVPPDDRDGVDDFYESFFNWPTLYLLGGSPDLLAACKHHWEGVSSQLSEAEMLHREFDRGYDWFHLGEGLLFFYGLCAADPNDPALIDRAARFADLYLDPEAGNYDAVLNIIRAPQTGANGARQGLTGGEPYFPWSDDLARYGLPLDWVAGIRSFDDLLINPAAGARMGAAMWASMARGDTAVNLASTSLALNAFLMTGEDRYPRWMLRYVDGWVERMSQHSGHLPDNVGLNGKVGEYLGGRTYGGHYGWSWPHGLHSVGTAAAIAACNAALVSRDDAYLDLGRSPLTEVLAHRKVARPDLTAMSMGERWIPHFQAMSRPETLLVPYRRADRGWHDFQPMQTALPAALWHSSASSQDWAMLEELQQGAGYDWTEVHVFRDKEEAGHEEPWLMYLAGANPAYPERALRAARTIVSQRLERLNVTEPELSHARKAGGIDFGQQANPVVTEVLLQLTCGGPQTLYNGGLMQARLRYFDQLNHRPGLPPGIAALVEAIEPSNVRVTLANTDDSASQSLTIQAGAFAEHQIVRMRIGRSVSRVLSPYVDVTLPGGSQIAVELTLELRANPPTYQFPLLTNVPARVF